MRIIPAHIPPQLLVYAHHVLHGLHQRPADVQRKVIPEIPPVRVVVRRHALLRRLALRQGDVGPQVKVARVAGGGAFRLGRRGCLRRGGEHRGEEQMREREAHRWIGGSRRG